MVRPSSTNGSGAISSHKLLGFLTLFLLVIQCKPESVRIDNEIGLVVFNHSGQEISKARFSLKDGNINEFNFRNPSIEILSLQQIEGKQQTPEQFISLRNFSSKGEGALHVDLFFTHGDSLSTSLGYFKNNRLYTEFAPAFWQTMEVIVNENISNGTLEAFSRIAHYENGIFRERY